MKQIILQIPDEQYQNVLDMLHNIPQAIIKTSLREKILLTPSQQKTWKNIKGAFKNLKLIQKGEVKTRSASDFLAELKNDGLL
jgi:hypothetical protein